MWTEVESKDRVKYDSKNKRRTEDKNHVWADDEVSSMPG